MSNSSEGKSTMNKIAMTSDNTNHIDGQQGDHAQAQQRANAPTATPVKQPQHAHKRPVALYWFLGFIVTMFAISELAQYMESQQLAPATLSQGTKSSAYLALQSTANNASVKNTIALAKSFINIIWNGQTNHIPPANINSLKQKILDALDDSEQKLKQQSKDTAHRRIGDVYDSAIANVDHFADWYYSLGAEYARVGHAIMQNSEQYLNDTVKRIIFTEQVRAQRRQAGALIDKEIRAFSNTQLKSIATKITHILSSNSVKKNTYLRDKADFKINFDQKFSGFTHSIIDWTGTDSNRQVASIGVGAIAGLTIGKIIGGSKIAISMGSAVMGSKALTSAGAILAKIAASKGLTAAGGTVAGATAGAGTGATVCAGTLVFGPFGVAADTACAVAGGLIGGAVAWFATDKVILVIQDYMGRDDFNNSIINKLNASRAVMLNQADAAIDQQIDALFATMRDKINQIQPPKSHNYTPAQLATKKINQIQAPKTHSHTPTPLATKKTK